MAKYLSHVKKVMVSIVALVDVSENNPCRMQTISLKGNAEGNQMLYRSTGIPVTKMNQKRNVSLFIARGFLFEDVGRRKEFDFDDSKYFFLSRWQIKYYLSKDTCDFFPAVTLLRRKDFSSTCFWKINLKSFFILLIFLLKIINKIEINLIFVTPTEMLLRYYFLCYLQRKLSHL